MNKLLSTICDTPCRSFFLSKAFFILASPLGPGEGPRDEANVICGTYLVSSVLLCVVQVVMAKLSAEQQSKLAKKAEELSVEQER